MLVTYFEYLVYNSTHDFSHVAVTRARPLLDSRQAGIFILLELCCDIDLTRTSAVNGAHAGRHNIPRRLAAIFFSSSVHQFEWLCFVYHSQPGILVVSSYIASFATLLGRRPSSYNAARRHQNGT